MLNHDQCISKITEMLECCEKFVIISLVQTDTWLIQNISHTHKTGTDLRRKPDSLCFSTGKSSCCTGKCQIFQTHIQKELQARFDLF